MKLPSADIAFKLRFFGMKTFMAFQAEQAHKRFIASVTGIGPFASVLTHVKFQFAFVRKAASFADVTPVPVLKIITIIDVSRRYIITVIVT